MGLIECPDCDGKVSDIAPACPHCGRPKPGEELTECHGCFEKISDSAKACPHCGQLMECPACFNKVSETSAMNGRCFQCLQPLNAETAAQRAAGHAKADVDDGSGIASKHTQQYMQQKLAEKYGPACPLCGDFMQKINLISITKTLRCPTCGHKI